MVKKRLKSFLKNIRGHFRWKKSNTPAEDHSSQGNREPEPTVGETAAAVDAEVDGEDDAEDDAGDDAYQAPYQDLISVNVHDVAFGGVLVMIGVERRTLISDASHRGPGDERASTAARSGDTLRPSATMYRWPTFANSATTYETSQGHDGTHLEEEQPIAGPSGFNRWGSSAAETEDLNDDQGSDTSWVCEDARRIEDAHRAETGPGGGS